MKNYALILTFLTLSSFSALAEQHSRDNNIRNYHNEISIDNDLNDKSDNNANPMFNNKLCSKNAEEKVFIIKRMGRNGGYDFSRRSTTNNLDSHYRNHR
ncbi:hypothetical protein Q2Y29_002998 [Vibrio alginolyticus]|nr:hypothetical protein [Vibrio alginolyticus]